MGVEDPEAGREVVVPFESEGGARRPAERCRSAALAEETEDVLARWKVEGRVSARARRLSPGGDARDPEVGSSCTGGSRGGSVV